MLAARRVSLNPFRYTTHRHMASIPPRLLFTLLKSPLRILAGATTAAIGYTGYKVHETSTWLNDTLNDVYRVGVKVRGEVGGIVGGWRDAMGQWHWDWRDNEQNNSNSSNNNNSNKNSSNVTAAMALAALVQSEESLPDQSYSPLIRKMIELRQILTLLDQDPNASPALQLPAIVVIGSQSSGKSSVLEMLIGHAFLPKGHNMVTRRPLELTLVHTPEAKQDYAVFSDAPQQKQFDFNQVQQKLTALNNAVSQEECVSSDPVHLTIYGAQMPDLVLVDLPGYIQIPTKEQPIHLREKIRQVCDKYLTCATQHLIVAVSAADVDLANSEALKAARRVDPRGERTLGVITKCDLVEKERIESLLSNKHYPLQLGYVGLVCRPNDSLQKSLTFERDFWQSMKAEQGTLTFKQKLSKALTRIMAQQLHSLHSLVRQSLEEVRYESKVHYHGRSITAESYVAHLLQSLRLYMHSWQSDYSRAKVYSLMRTEMNERALAVCESVFWSGERESMDPRNAWHEMIRAKAMLVKSGLGKAAVQSIAQQFKDKIVAVFGQDPFHFHSQSFSALEQHLITSLSQRAQETAYQVEHSLRPLKRDDAFFTVRTWQRARLRLIQVMQSRLEQAKQELVSLQQRIGGKEVLATAVLALKENPSNERQDLVLAQEAVKVHKLMRVLQERLTVVEKHCDLPMAVMHAKQQKSIWWWRRESKPTGESLSVPMGQELSMPSASSPAFNTPRYEYHDTDSNDSELLISYDPCQLLIPEMAVFMLAEQVADVCTTCVYSDLVTDFLGPLSELDDARETLLTPSAAAIAKENPSVAKHLALGERLRALEQADQKLCQLKTE